LDVNKFFLIGPEMSRYSSFGLQQYYIEDMRLSLTEKLFPRSPGQPGNQKNLGGGTRAAVAVKPGAPLPEEAGAQLGIPASPPFFA